MKKFESKEVFTIPNLLTLLRIIIIAPCISAFLDNNYLLLSILLIISALSDMLDGMIARHFNQQTKLGAVIDPIADKLTLLAVVLCAAVKIPSILPLVIIMAAKELLMLTGGFVLIKKKLSIPSAQWYGKLSTVIFYSSVIILVVVYIATGSINSILPPVLMTITALFMLYSLVRYSMMFLNIIKGNKKFISKK